MNSRITVIIPTRNRSELLRETVNSVLSQTLLPQEILIVDDHSSSDHADALRDIAASNSCISLLRTDERKGVSAARNLGLEKATSDYILFIDDDDLIHPQMLETSMGIFKNNMGADIVACLSEIFFSPGDPGFKYPLKALDPIKPVRAIRSDESPSVVLLRHYHPVNSSLIRRESISNLRFSENIIQGEDTLFWLSLAARDCKFVWHDKIHAFVRRHPGNKTRSKMQRYKEGRPYLEEALKKGFLKEKADLFLCRLKLFQYNLKIKSPETVKYFFYIIKSPILLIKEFFRYSFSKFKARREPIKYYFTD
jgi:glycosyltransferase involved in cell wall biosynthesis